jgi:hypothetical protein
MNWGKYTKPKKHQMKIAFILLLTLFSTVLVAQSFEGKIMYRNSYKSKLPTVSDDQWNDMLGTSQEYLIKGGDYKSVLNGSLMQWQLYRQADNKIYNKMANSETLLWNDGAINADEILKSEINRGVAEVLGYKCDELILTSKSGIQKYYFNSKFSVDPALFEQHKFGNWGAMLKATKAIPLKIIINNEQITLESVAVEIKPGKLDNSSFALPEGVQIAKSPY